MNPNVHRRLIYVYVFSGFSKFKLPGYPGGVIVFNMPIQQKKNLKRQYQASFAQNTGGPDQTAIYRRSRPFFMKGLVLES